MRILDWKEIRNDNVRKVSEVAERQNRFPPLPTLYVLVQNRYNRCNCKIDNRHYCKIDIIGYGYATDRHRMCLRCALINPSRTRNCSLIGKGSVSV